MFGCIHIPSIISEIREQQQWPNTVSFSRGQAAFVLLYIACLCGGLHLMSTQVRLPHSVPFRIACSYRFPSNGLFPGARGDGI
jgi:hypothetical protein